jgi:hypothetical protein
MWASLNGSSQADRSGICLVDPIKVLCCQSPLAPLLNRCPIIGIESITALTAPLIRTSYDVVRRSEPTNGERSERRHPGKRHCNDSCCPERLNVHRRWSWGQPSRSPMTSSLFCVGNLLDRTPPACNLHQRAGKPSSSIFNEAIRQESRQPIQKK